MEISTVQALATMFSHRLHRLLFETFLIIIPHEIAKLAARSLEMCFNFFNKNSIYALNM